MLEVRVALGVTTYIRFDAPLDRASLEVEGRSVRFRFVDVGERLIALEPAVEPGPGEKVIARVRYKDGAAPAYASFALVSHPSLVDGQVEVVRRPRTLERLEAELAQWEESGPARLVLSGLLDRWGVLITDFQGRVPPENRSGLSVGRGTVYRTLRWMVVTVWVTNLPGQKSWVPGAVRLFSAEGSPLRVRFVQLQEKSQLLPGETGLIVVQADPLVPSERPFRLEMVDAEGGRLLPIHGVLLRGGVP